MLTATGQERGGTGRHFSRERWSEGRRPANSTSGEDTGRCKAGTRGAGKPSRAWGSKLCRVQVPSLRHLASPCRAAANPSRFPSRLSFWARGVERVRGSAGAKARCRLPLGYLGAQAGGWRAAQRSLQPGGPPAPASGRVPSVQGPAFVGAAAGAQGPA